MPRSIRTIGLLKKLVYLLAVLCFVVLSITGFGPWLILQKRLAGYWAMAHVTFAPVFALCMAALAVMCADNLRFDKSDWNFLSRIFRRRAPDEGPVSNGSVLIMKVCFWLVCVLAVPLFLSSVLSMFPLFGTAGQKFLFHLHRYSALFLALAAIVHTYLVIRTQTRKQ
jgi:cytochrome b subunit of formate dehydrogenase